jgi:ABC-2 type transport system permease protein
MAIFFLFFTVGFSARSLLAERETGTLARIGAAPVPGWAVLAGKAIPAFVIGLTSMTVMLVVMRLMFGATWGDPVAVAVLTLVTVLGIFGVTAIVQTLARNQQQADSYAGMVGIVFALLGGNFFPLDQLPGPVRQIAMFTPNGRALRAFSDLAALGGGLGSIWPHLVVIGGFGILGMTAGALRMGRVVAA